MRQALVLLAALVAAVASAASHAALITWELAARITTIDPDLVGYASLGDTIRYRMTFDGATPDSEPGVLERGKYDDAIVRAELFIGAQTASASGNVGYITVVNDFATPARDGLLAPTTSPWANPLAAFNGFSFTLAGFSFTDFDATMFAGDALLPNPNFAAADKFDITLGFEKPIAPNVYLGSAIRSTELVSFERIAEVPAPSTAALLASGLLGAAAWRRVPQPGRRRAREVGGSIARSSVN